MRAQRGSFSALQAASQSDGIVTGQYNAMLGDEQRSSMRCDAAKDGAGLGCAAINENAASDESGRDAFRHDGKEAPPKKKVGGIFFGERECERTMVGRNTQQVPGTSCDGLKVGKG